MNIITREKNGHTWQAYFIPFANPVCVKVDYGSGEESWEDYAIGWCLPIDADQEREFMITLAWWVSFEHCIVLTPEVVMHRGE